MNILFLPAWYPTTERPVHGTFIKDHAKAVSTYNDVVVVYCETIARKDKYISNKISDKIEDGIRTIRIKHSDYYFGKLRQFIEIFHIFATIRMLTKNGWRPDIIHGHIFLSGFAAVIIGKIFKIPVVVSEHWSAFPLGTLKKLNEFEARFVLSRVSIILPVSKDLKNSIKSYGIKKRFKVIPNAINTDFFNPTSIPSRNKEKKRILTVALLKPVKGIDYLIRAVAKLIIEREDFVLDIVGDGPNRSEYEKLTQNEGLSRFIKFHGLKNKSEVAHFMAQCDFYVQVSLYETFGVTSIEAMSCGKPVLASDLPSMRDKINASRGILVPPRNVAALAGALGVMLDHYQEYSADEIAQYVQNDYSYEAVGLKFTKIYHEVLGRKLL
ncbi:MAG: glycosyltransferase [Deltaproteobacteria bacterium]|nr:glycosyltransferase [Deltaproteobacteria bacterium]